MRKSTAIASLGGYFEKIARVYSRDYGVTVRMGPAGEIPRMDLKSCVITLPADLEFADKSIRQIIEGMLDHETAHARTEMEFDGDERYSIFHERAFHEDPALTHMLNIFEDARIERDASSRWRGVARNIRVKNDYYNRAHEKRYEIMVATGDEPSKVSLFLQSLNRWLRLGELPEWIPEDVKELAANFEDIVERAEKIWCPRDVDELAREAYKLLNELAEPSPPPVPSPSSGTTGGGSGGSIAGGEPGEEPGKEKSEAQQELSVKILEEFNDPKNHGIDLESRESWRMLNIHMEAARYKMRTYYLPHPLALKADRIVVPGKDEARYNKARELARPVISGLVRRLAMWLRAQIDVTVLDQEEGDIDDESLPYVMVGEHRIFQADRPAIKLDTAWSVLIDQSGSMGSGDRRGEKAYWARPAAIALGEALHKCGIPFEMWGWDTSQSRVAEADKIHTRCDRQRHFQYKTFRETWPRIRKRCGRITGFEDNDDVSAIYFVARRLVQRREKRKVLLVLSDGQPNHHSFRHGGQGRSFYMQQLKDTIKLVEAAGITPLGVGILSDHVKLFYKNTLVIDSLNGFAAQLVRLVRTTVRGT